MGRRLTGATFVALLSLSGCLLLTAPVSLAATAPTSGSEFALPDARAWELVSPPDKHGSELHGINQVGLVQAAADGRAITYTAVGPVVAEPQGFQVFNTSMLSTRGSAGWSSYNISTPNNKSTGLPVGNSNEYQFFSTGLSAGLINRGGRVPLLSDEALEETLYLRDTACGLLTFESRCYTPLLTGCPPPGEPCPQSVEEHADIPPGTRLVNPSTGQSNIHFESATPDLAHVVVGSGVALTQAGSHGLYEWSAGRPPAEQVQPVSVLPDGTMTSCEVFGGRTGGNIPVGSISPDGSRVVWLMSEGGECPPPSAGHLYLRDMARRETVQLDVCQPGASCSTGGGNPEPEFQLASSDGSRVFFTEAKALTVDSGATYEKNDLYVCEVKVGEASGKLECDLNDLTPQSAGESAEVLGTVLGASEDGSSVYFVANGVLASNAKPGDCRSDKPPPAATCNLYVSHYDEAAKRWETRFVAALSSYSGAGGPEEHGDERDWSGPLPDQPTRVSPNGRFLAFMSQQSLTGYDNRDAQSGEPDEEVFLYDAAANGGAGELHCASCDPTGARPAGVLAFERGGELYGARLVDKAGTWPGHWLAALVPGWTPSRLGEAMYQSRYLSDEGRLFFDSHDALVAHDTNGTWDVYEYEPPGVGGCSASSSAFSAGSSGCVGLISSGTSSEESAFLDASETGNDVFFLTAAKLVPADRDTSFDVYDAHVCSSESPCITEPVSPPACTTTDSCREAPEPQPQLFGPPSSATLAGPGNPAPPATRRSVKPKLTRAQQLTRALSSCRKRYKKTKPRRATCERQAKRRYATTARHATHHPHHNNRRR